MRILINITDAEKAYQGYALAEFKQHGHSVRATYGTYCIDTLLDLARRIGAEAILCTHPKTIANLVPTEKNDATTWRGSVLQMSVPIVIAQPLYALRSSATGKLLFQIDVAKLAATRHGAWKYDFTICHSHLDLQEAKMVLQDAPILAIDIETTLYNKISSIAFTPILDDYSIGKTYTISLMPDHYRDEETLYEAWWVVKSLCEGEAAKVFHNGCFDCFQLLRFHIVVNNYLWDTEYLWRCWYAELPKALDKISSFLLPDHYYWKYESDLNPLEYNAKDTINTARIFIKLLQKAPEWVWKNYSQLVPNIAPVIYCSFEGFLTDVDKRAAARKEAQAEVDQLLQELQDYTGLLNFNPGSHKQVSTLIYDILGAKKPGRAKSESATGKIELAKVALQHPLYGIFTDRILKYKTLAKAISTYYDARLDHQNRLYYSLSLDGTETARMACSASSLYAPPPEGKKLTKTSAKNLGTQLQNIPPYLKKAMLADPGYELIDTDKSQSEARCTAYLAGSEALRQALENPPATAGVHDFYCYTGLRFFGVEFDKKHDLRQIVKKIIHGTNYIMGEETFIDSVGILEMQKYRKLVGFRGSLPDFASYLLGLYHDIYPEVKEGWQATVKEVVLTGRVITPDGWTRLVLGDIASNKAVMREIVAHKSQHFSVVGINEALWKLFYYVQVPSNGEYRLKGQIHDSVVSQAKKEKIEYYCKKQEEVMDIPQPTPFGVLRIPLETNTSYYWKQGK